VVGPAGKGIAKTFPHSSGTVWRIERIAMLVNVARRTLNCISVIRWSGVKGKVIGPGIDDGELGVR
jgi:hypothetical protein